MCGRDGISSAECSCCCGGSSDCGLRTLLQLTSDIGEFKSIATAAAAADRDKEDKEEKERNFRIIPDQVNCSG